MILDCRSSFGVFVYQNDVIGYIRSTEEQIVVTYVLLRKRIHLSRFRSCLANYNYETYGLTILSSRLSKCHAKVSWWTLVELVAASKTGQCFQEEALPITQVYLSSRLS